MPLTAPSSIDTTRAHAESLDARDPLKSFREQFNIPKVRDVRPGAAPGGAMLGPDDNCIYLCGNSLGLMPKHTRDAVLEDLDAWARLGVEGHLHARHPWYPAHEFLRDNLARLVGAKSHEVVAMNSLTTNLHLMMATFYRPQGERTRIVIEDSAFPSDSYAVQSQAAFHGLDTRDAIIRLKPRAGERTLRTEDVCVYLNSQGSKVALVLLGGVNYLTGQVMDMGAITEAGHRAGAMVGWDLAHATGNIDLRLHDWNADFACWCSYKYLNSGAGAVAGCFVHEKHSKNTATFNDPSALRRFSGWWGNDPKTRFVMGPEFVPVASADAWSLSNPPVLALTPVRVSLEIFDSATMPKLLDKSRAMTGYLRSLLESVPGADQHVDISTPREDGAHGCQLSIAVKTNPRAVHNALTAAGVVCDFREPNVVRIAPVPLYNTYMDCWRFAEVFRASLKS
jgi:kynureninase